MKSNDITKKDDRDLWINREKEDYHRIMRELCISSKVISNPNEQSEHVTEIRNGFLITLCCHCIQGADELSVPVDKSRAASWNLPLCHIFDDAINNTPRIYPAVIYDIKKRKNIITTFAESYEYDPDYDEISEAAEDQIIPFPGQGTDPVPELRFIVNASPLLGEGLFFYKDMLTTIGKVLRNDPVILSAAPGKLFVFDSGVDGGEFPSEHLKKYMDRFDSITFEPHIFRYHRVHKSLSDMSPGRNLIVRNNEYTKIPRGSVLSAWGDLQKRRELIDWKKRNGKKEEPDEPDVPKDTE